MCIVYTEQVYIETDVEVLLRFWPRCGTQTKAERHAERERQSETESEANREPNPSAFFFEVLLPPEGRARGVLGASAANSKRAIRGGYIEFTSNQPLEPLGRL